jgi:5-formyltetrahydrofolate cyclo-ligase
MADAKAALRKSIRATLRALSPTAIAAASDRACARANTLISAETSGVCCYLAMPKAECLTAPLLTQLFAASKPVYVPRVTSMEDRHGMRMLRVADSATLDNFPRSKWGIPEPTDEQCESMEDGLETAAIELVIVPGVAFDASCRRLGQGRGYYDTFLEKLAAARKAKGLPPALTIGLGLQEQLVDAVPVDAHDVPLDYVCLPDVLFSSGGSSSSAEAPASEDVPQQRSLRPKKAKLGETTTAPPPHPVHGRDTGLLPED